MTPTEAAQTLDDRSRWIALIVLCVGMLMIVLDTTVVNVALPSGQTDPGFTRAAVAPVGAPLGLVRGGVLPAAITWLGFFFITVPIGVIPAALAMRLLPHDKGAG